MTPTRTPSPELRHRAAAPGGAVTVHPRPRAHRPRREPVRPGAGPASRRPAASVQRLTIDLEGITAGDYLAYVADPEPACLGCALCSAAVDAAPLGDRIHVLLRWQATPPAPAHAAAIAGLPRTPEVLAVRGTALSAAPGAGGRDGSSASS